MPKVLIHIAQPRISTAIISSAVLFTAIITACRLLKKCVTKYKNDGVNDNNQQYRQVPGKKPQLLTILIYFTQCKVLLVFF